MERLGLLAPHQTATERPRSADVLLIGVDKANPRRILAMPRELIEPHKGDKRYVRRNKGKISSRQTDVGRSLSADRPSKAKRVVKKGEGDRGDHRRRAT
jgi:hypothetical protein